uniref:VHS domain-containing protein n=1 Tax=Rhodosorus marinus TaxID=101924 RepID=A0A7S0G0H9_9RHOD|mmetsp:Transcript_11657/g.16858  ORF Transcript_11657/g.16858 Transcript_11657/m.16858 type:complete len:625 (+) Transcript_11657:213-2087(+)|eukprot:CAMPEP_0184737918 /NCGR_PEP_ID=MMETSP0315-20130426/681_1 /TAXON_ID=101924 /ORGANISM="Rhodosorus marinus, Strain UTEX LB 2760" /LENGTH=624 /DNA_ID=CAMNT_0027205389 /DNA_START=200 /DNA_END=2074 /DNA_ORIENTATION=-
MQEGNGDGFAVSSSGQSGDAESMRAFDMKKFGVGLPGASRGAEDSPQAKGHAGYLVDAATGPGLSSEQKFDGYNEIANFCKNGGGSAVAFSIGERLQTTDLNRAMRVLECLEEMMRTVPFFYRYTANQHFFKRLWRYVNPYYKSGILQGKAVTYPVPIMRKVLMLVRAWAYDLHKMYAGKYEPAAAFWVERYNTKRAKVSFPEPPKGVGAWICPVDERTDRKLRSQNSIKGMSVDAMENLATLLESIVHNSYSVHELESNDALPSLIKDGRSVIEGRDSIAQNLAREDDVSRCVELSERLERVISKYDEALATGVVPEDKGISRKPAEHPEGSYYSTIRSDRYPLDEDPANYQGGKSRTYGSNSPRVVPNEYERPPGPMSPLREYPIRSPSRSPANYARQPTRVVYTAAPVYTAPPPYEYRDYDDRDYAENYSTEEEEGEDLPRKKASSKKKKKKEGKKSKESSPAAAPIYAQPDGQPQTPVLPQLFLSGGDAFQQPYVSVMAPASGNSSPGVTPMPYMLSSPTMSTGPGSPLQLVNGGYVPQLTRVYTPVMSPRPYESVSPAAYIQASPAAQQQVQDAALAQTQQLTQQHLVQQQAVQQQPQMQQQVQPEAATQACVQQGLRQ